MRPWTIALGALIAQPASATDPERFRVRAGAELLYAFGAKQPWGAGVTLDATVIPPQLRVLPPSIAVGGGVRLETWADRSVQLAFEPSIGLTMTEQDHLCGVGASSPEAQVQLRPGLALRTRGGPAVTLAAAFDASAIPFSARTRVGFAIPLLEDPTQPAHASGRLEDLTAGLGLGLTSSFSCSDWMVGRPLREGDGVVLPTASHQPRHAAASSWLTQAQEEYAAVGAFLKLAAELHELGAPASLVQACVSAAADEVRHAVVCLGRAASLAGLPLELDMPDVRSRSFADRRSGLLQLALESWADGFLNEGHAAVEAARAASLASDATDRRIHARIAEEERAHALLGATITGWCVQELARA